MKKLLSIISVLVFISSCSSTKVLHDGQTRLVANKVVVEGDKRDPSTSKSTISKYIYQTPPISLWGWNPLICVYNWTTNGKTKGWDKFVQTIGRAPTVYDSTKVVKSNENISNHLFYNGFYNNKVTNNVKTVKKNTWVTYNVTTGSRRKIDKIDFTLPSGGTFATDFIASRK
ncbi:MAG: hypothetical protein HUJ95_01390, partial [Bacteroidales bacterium]|nr:hypothetical protein [Bacteroidales bacterium]